MLLRSFGYAIAGAAHILRTQGNARVELVIGFLAVVAGLWLGLDPVAWAVLALTITLVVCLEWVNTSIELAVTLASPQTNPVAKAAKDVSAAAVLASALGAVVVGLFLFGPRLVARLLAP